MSIQPTTRLHISGTFPLLAPKGKASPSHPETPVLQLENNNTRDEQDTVPSTHVNLQRLAFSQSHIPVVSSGYDFTLPPLFPPDSVVPGPERKQYATIYPNIYTNGASLALANDSLPGFTPRNLLSGAQAMNSKSLDSSTQHPPYDNLQLQETIPNWQSQDYWIPPLNTPEVWPAPIGVHQRQCSTPSRTLSGR